ncbi:aminomethyltransferase [Pseudorhodobacter antarcticus]|uniref:aminomethyltransferase n=1 Tax=Pseudorhodobacter antarcticus TaxID=1077947 RepID=A0A1H8B8C3_9RHOB|nr:glycine cleavage system aminomethyltransferase GcvT [Pseudorhodobacter antarcticus]SEM78629.1 aminomethyltransferase [Pseudorhodobacter antarcticus]
MADLKRTGLFDLHVDLGAKMVPFAGYEMPVQYPMGVMGEHLHCRAQAGLFDVSHMGRLVLRPLGDMAALEAGLEAMMPVAVAGLAEGRQRYGLLTNAQGGIIDDLMFANRGDHIFMVVNAGCKAGDIAHLRVGLAGIAEVIEVADRCLIALQGPQAEEAISGMIQAVMGMRFMDVITAHSVFGELWISRSGYTGEDGFEISVPNGGAAGLARALLAHPAVAPIGLGARDSLRLEAGLCLYGHDMDEGVTPVEAGLVWAISKSRRGGGFPGDAVILAQLADGPARVRVGLRPEGRAPMREGVEIFDRLEGGQAVGRVTSGGFGPSVEAPIAMGFVPAAQSAVGTQLWGEVRGKRLPVAIAALPFQPTTYKR